MAAFEQIKSLEGRWLGQMGEGDDAEPVEMVYSVISNGTAVIERETPGSETSMVTVYYLAGDELLATHYCAIGNQPAYRYSPENSTDRLSLVFAGGTGFDPATDAHVHDGWIRIVNADRIEHSWSFYQDGKEANRSHWKLSRVAD